MGKGRLEAFSDGVIAIILTIMVLELRAPESGELAALRPVLPHFLAYVLSFLYVGIYWNNHHHMLQAVERVNGRILWANLQLLFFLSLVPAVTAWLGEHHHEPWPVALYGAVLLGAGLCYFVLARELVRHHGPESALARALGSDVKGRISLVGYAGALVAAFWLPQLSLAAYLAIAVLWLVPDRRIERTLEGGREQRRGSELG